MYVAIGRVQELVVLLREQALEERRCERVTVRDAGRRVGGGEPCVLVQPLPEDAEPNLAGRHVLHEVEHVGVPEGIGRLERGRLVAAGEGVPVLQRHREQIARAAYRARRGLEHQQCVGCGAVVRERRERASALVGRAGGFPYRTKDVDHLPVRDPFATRARLLLARAAGRGARHTLGDALRRADRDVGLHAALPERESAAAIRRVHRAAHPSFIVAQVAVGHGDRADVGIHECAIPRQRVGDAVDVVPASGVEPHEAGPERGADLHQLEGGFELLHEHVGLDARLGETDMTLERQEDVVPERGLLGRLDLGHVEDQRASLGPQHLVVVHDVERCVHDRSREVLAVAVAHMPVDQVQAAGAEDPRGEGELSAPIGDSLAAERLAGPGVHLGRDLFGDAEEPRVGGERELEVAVIVERHRLDLPQCVLAVEHPAVGTGEQGVGDVTKAGRQVRPRPRGRARALDPLALQVGRDLGAVEPPCACVADGERGPGNDDRGVEEIDPSPLTRPGGASLDALAHQPFPVVVEGGQCFEGAPRVRSEHVGVLSRDVRAHQEAASGRLGGGRVHGHARVSSSRSTGAKIGHGTGQRHRGGDPRGL